MCGLVGILANPQDLSLQMLESMTAALRHRGPDSTGVWLAREAGVGLGSVRLAILDPNDGQQPMTSPSGRFVIAYNGEIYNFAELREELESLGFTFRGRSDTEVALAAIEQWGVEQAVRRFNGMFAFALWDGLKQRLYLVRDRVGEKPLYYCDTANLFLCASELKALHRHPMFKPEVDLRSLAFYLRYGYILDPHTIYKRVHKLLPGTILEVWRTANGTVQTSGPYTYWSTSETMRDCLERPFVHSEAEALEELESLLLDAVRLRMVADVPVGALLSGGVDSSTIVALMQAARSSRVKTFTLGFSESNYDEAPYAAAIARHLGADHTELYVSGKEAAEVIVELPHLFDEPFGDYSELPTYLVARLARQQVVVSLTGEGGDELFGGYERYVTARALWRIFGWMPIAVRKKLAALIAKTPPEIWENRLEPFNRILPRYLRQARLGEKVHKLAEVFESSSREDLYFGLVSHWTRPEEVLVPNHISAPMLPLDGAGCPESFNDWLSFVMYVDFITYLPGDILTKVDRATMGVSLEGRMPFLDHRVVQFAWSLPVSMKIRRGRTKYLLRKLLSKYVPEKLIERPKMGFGAPIGVWLRGPLREWAESLLQENSLRRYGFLDPRPIRQQWLEHLSCRRNWQHRLWVVLMLQAWSERWL